MAETCQVIDGDAGFNHDGLQQFISDSGIAACRTNYQVVAIMGPQSSGKSTLMNHVFGTAFVEMDALKGRQQTTKGVWLAKSPKIDEPVTLVMDLEGSDGRERGEDNTNFERQSALFALAVADVLLVNIWCHDIGREQGSGKPLLKTIFQVNLKLFSPDPLRRRTVLLFVIRDKSKTPLSRLTAILEEDLHRMWDSIVKPEQYADSKIDQFFELKYTALPNFEEKYEDFIADSVVLRRRFTEEVDDTLVAMPVDKLPADSLALSTQKIWNVIRSQKDLNLPAHKVMVANIRCNEIKLDQLRCFEADQAWEGLVAEGQDALVRGFAERAGGLRESCLQGYDTEAAFFDSSVRREHRANLEARLLDVLEEPVRNQLKLLAGQELSQFDKDFRLALAERKQGFSRSADEAKAAAVVRFNSGCKDVLIEGTSLTAGAARARLEQQIDDQVSKAKHQAIKDATHAADVSLTKLITIPVVEVLQHFAPNQWPKLHSVRINAVAAAGQQLFQQLEGVDLTAEERRALEVKMEGLAAAKMSQHLQEAALTRVSRMKDRFHEAFAVDKDGTPRTWRPQENIPALARQARLAAAGVLAALAVVRPADYQGPDLVEWSITRMARVDVGDDAKDKAPAAEETRFKESGFDLSAATHWPDVPEKDVLVAPYEARLAWRELVAASGLSVQQAQVTQQANLMAGKRAPPVWALLAILFFGWNEMMAVLWNPIYLVLGLVCFLVGWQLYSELDVDSEMQRGTMTGLLTIYSNMGSALRSVIQRNLDAAMVFVQHGVQMAQDGIETHQVREGSASPAKQLRGINTPNNKSSSSSSAHQLHLSAQGLGKRKEGQAPAEVEMTTAARPVDREENGKDE